MKGQPLRFVRFHHAKVPTEDLFWAKVERGAPDQCWEWRRHRNRDGYGSWGYRVTEGKRRIITEPTHRAAWRFTHGPIPDGMCVLHECDNPACCNPAHLRLGTQQDNVTDMIAKGRDTARRKLTPETVREARILYASGDFTYAQLADRFGVSHTVVTLAIARKTWKHVP